MTIGVDRSALELVTDVSVGDWIAPRRGPFGGSVGSVVPRCYAAYAPHPVPDTHGPTLPPARWARMSAPRRGDSPTR